MTFDPILTIRRGLVAAAVVLASIACSASPSTPSSASSSPDVAATSPTPEPTVPTPEATPEGTPAPHPDEVTVDSADIETPAPPADATATPAPQAGLWRVDGYVVDESGSPLKAVCVVIGPRGCQPFSPHTDDRGYWFIDIAEGTSTFDFYFEMPGFNTVWWHTTPTGPTTHNVILTKS